MSHEPPAAHASPPHDSRRSFLRWAIHGLGALFAVILGFPAVMYLIDPRNRPARPKGPRPVEGINLRALVKNEPKQGMIRDVRRDAWTLHPNDVIGRVWAVRHGDGDLDVDVFTTVCPHLGCSINMATDGARPTGFVCPCHNGQFHLDGSKVAVEGVSNPPPRGMDKLAWEADPANPDRMLVYYVNYKQMEATPIERT